MSKTFTSAIKYAQTMLERLAVSVSLESFKDALDYIGMPYACTLEGTDDGDGKYNVSFIPVNELADIRTVMRDVGADAEFTICTLEFRAHQNAVCSVNDPSPKYVCECIGFRCEISTFEKCKYRQELFEPILTPGEMAKYLDQIDGTPCRE